MDAVWIATTPGSTTINGCGVSNSIVYTTIAPSAPLRSLSQITPLSINSSSSVMTSVSSEVSLFNNGLYSSSVPSSGVIQITDFVFTNNASSGYFLTVIVYKNDVYSPALTYSYVDSVRSSLQYNLAGTSPTTLGAKLKTYTIASGATASFSPQDIFLSPGEELVTNWVLSSGSGGVVCAMVINANQIG